LRMSNSQFQRNFGQGNIFSTLDGLIRDWNHVVSTAGPDAPAATLKDRRHNIWSADLPQRGTVFMTFNAQGQAEEIQPLGNSTERQVLDKLKKNFLQRNSVARARAEQSAQAPAAPGARQPFGL